jgi:hypothetical protein
MVLSYEGHGQPRRGWGFPGNLLERLLIPPPGFPREHLSGTEIFSRRLSGMAMLFVSPSWVKRLVLRRIPMPDNHSDQDALFEEANRLYWESDESVNHIGETLGLSKGVLYGLIAAHPAGLPCPECGEEMVFPNRTAREKGFLACPDCGKEEAEEAVQAFWEGRSDEAPDADLPEPRAFARRAGQAMRRAANTGRERVTSLTPRGRVLAGTALLGIAAGLFLGAHFRRR